MFDFATSVESTDNATVGTDFETTSRTGETIVADAPNYTFNVPITGDNTPEPDETFTVTLSNVTTSIVPIDLIATGTIENDDGSLVTIASSSNLAEGADTETGTMTFTVTAAPPAGTGGFTVEWATSVVDGVDNATADDDFDSPQVVP